MSRRYFKTCGLSLNLRIRNLRNEKKRIGMTSQIAQKAEVFYAYDLLTELIAVNGVASEVKSATILQRVTDTISANADHSRNLLGVIFDNYDPTDNWIFEAIVILEDSVRQLNKLESEFYS